MAFTPPDDKIAYKRLVVAGSNKIYYGGTGVSAGDMSTELDTSGYAIDTSDQLNMFEAFQKVFVVNGGVLGVADFVNTKLSTADVRPNDVTNVAPMKGTILTGGTTTAQMVVDYCDANNGAALIYGYVISGTFDDDDEIVIGTNADGTPTAVSFTLDAMPAAKPHWYAWTVYPTIGGESFGTMPAKAYLGCLYRGRNVLAGNPNYPHQWYMSKIGDPWNWVYASTDPLTAAAGNAADAGETGDIIRALIPYKDDYLIFGCASTIWVLTGDPAAGGEIDEVDLTVGMFGANSWCFDGDGNLYFWGTAGIYKIPLGFRSVENLTEISLPDLISDEGADPSSHRITMAYDRKRHGILICITKLSDGTNSNYWYDLKLQGFFPESYPDECGPYSLFYYAANDTDYTDLLVGCKDGYIRKFDNTAKDDNTGSGSTDPISSYAVWPIQHLTEDNDKEGKLTSLTIELAGGAGANGSNTFPDTDAVSYDIHVGDDAETVIEDIRDGATPFTTGTLSGTGRKARIRTRVRGAWLGIKFYNSTASETWAVNKVFGIIKDAGRIK